jgi:hypothetical protein
MAIMTAGMHSPGMGAGIGLAGFLLHRQRINIRSQSDARFPGVARQTDCGGGGSGNPGGKRNIQPPQFRADHVSSLMLFLGKFRNRMEALSQTDRVRQGGGKSTLDVRHYHAVHPPSTTRL